MHTQSNTQAGPIVVPSSVDLTGKEGYLAKLGTSSSVTKAALATAAADAAIFVIDDGGAASGDDVKLLPLEPSRNYRVKVAAGSAGGNAGVVVDLQSDGTVDTTGASGARLQVGVTEESFVAGQLVKLRPLVQRFLS